MLLNCLVRTCVCFGQCRSGLRPRPPRYGQAREISRIAAAPDFPFDPDLLRHVSPIEWKNVILYGEIKIDPSKLKMRGS